MNDKLKKIAQDKGLIKGMGLALSKLSGIDKSTVSAHLTGTKKLSMYHAEKYAHGLEVPVIKLIDEKIVKYPVGAYVENNGSVRLRNEIEDEIIVSENHILNTSEVAIYNKDYDVVYFYDNDRHCHQTDVINRYCYIKTDKENFMGDIEKLNKKTLKITFWNRYTKKYQIKKLIKAYPINSIHFLKETTLFKIQDSL